MFFSLLKIYARIVFRIYCRRLVVNKPEYLKAKGPLLFAANHPASFLDGVVLTTLLDENLYALARGDAFKSRWKRFLYKLHLLPVFRTSEGIENLAQNYATFSECHRVFKKDGVVLIFSEAVSLNEWRLRPLRKGTARLAISAWQKGIPLTVVPLGFNYSSFKDFGKNIHLLFGKPIDRAAVLAQESEGKQLLRFNEQLQQQLKGLVYEIDASNTKELQRLFGLPVSLIKRLSLALPAAAGWLLHAPLYYPVKAITKYYFNNDHFDGVLAALLMLLYPVYLIAAFFITMAFLNWGWALFSIVFLPFCAWALVQLKPQIS